MVSKTGDDDLGRYWGLRQDFELPSIAEAQAALISAKEDFPQLATLRKLQFDPATPASWREIIYPKYPPQAFRAEDCTGQ